MENRVGQKTSGGESGVVPAELELLFETAADAILLADVGTGNLLDANSAAERLFGWPRSRLHGRHFLFLIPPDRLAEAKAMFERHVRSAGGPEEMDIVHADGRRIPVAATAACVDYRGRRVLVGLFRDLTTQKRHEEAARESRVRFEEIVRNTHAGYFRVDCQGVYRDVNDAFLRMHGYTDREEIVGRHFSATQVDTDMETAQGYVEALLAGRSLSSEAFTRRCKDGSVGHHIFSASPVTEAGRVVGLEGFLIDVTERKIVERRYRSTVDLSPIGMLFYRLESDRRLVLEGINPGAETMLGVVKETLVGKMLEEAFPPLADSEIPERFRRLAESGGSWRIDDVAYAHGPVDGVYDVVAFQTQPGHVTVLFSDISERKRAEVALRRSRDELERKVQERTARLRDLASQLTRAEHKERRRIAHVLHEDLQQRLVALRYRIGAACVRDPKGAVPFDAESAMKELADAIQLTRNLTSHLSPPVLYDLGLSAALAWLADRMRAEFEFEVRLEVEVDADWDFACDDIRAFVFEAVGELLMNVVKHAGVRGARVQTRQLGNGMAAVAVSDAGRGFDPEWVCRPTSFGLFSIRERAEALGGKLTLASRPGEGAQATLVLPLAAGKVR